MATSSTLEIPSAPSRKQQQGCNDCLLHLIHHVFTDECWDTMIDFLIAECDRPDTGMSPVERYHAEYESRLLGHMTRGSDVCGFSEP